MNYIYDILINYQDVLYDFFDWNSDDKIDHVRKIPIFRLDPNNFDKIKNYKIKISDDFLTKIKNKTEVFSNRKVKNIEYASLFSNGIEVMGIKFDNDGYSIQYSNLLIDENVEVIEVCEKLDETEVEFKALNKVTNDIYITRKDKDIITYINKELEKLKNDNNLEKLKYLYYDCFNQKSDDKEYILDKLSTCLTKPENNFYIKLYNFFKLTTIKKI